MDDGIPPLEVRVAVVSGPPSGLVVAVVAFVVAEYFQAERTPCGSGDPAWTLLEGADTGIVAWAVAAAGYWRMDPSFLPS